MLCGGAAEEWAADGTLRSFEQHSFERSDAMSATQRMDSSLGETLFMALELGQRT